MCLGYRANQLNLADHLSDHKRAPSILVVSSLVQFRQTLFQRATCPFLLQMASTAIGCVFITSRIRLFMAFA